MTATLLGDVAGGGVYPPDMQPATRFIDLAGRTHVADYGGSGEPIILVHGLGGYHQNWNSLAGPLTNLGAVHALDLAGFGLSPPEGRKTTVTANADLVMRFARHVAGDAPVTLIGNSMGGLISIIAASQHPAAVARLVLIDPALPVEVTRYEPIVAMNLAIPTLPVIGPQYISHLWKTTPAEDLVLRSQELIYADTSRSDPQRTAEAIQFAKERRNHDYAARSFAQAARSIAGLNRSRKRFTAIASRIMAHTLVIHGDQDRLVPLDSARWLTEIRPDWRLAELVGTGHVPMLEQPKETFEAIAEWWVEQASEGA